MPSARRLRRRPGARHWRMRRPSKPHERSRGANRRLPRKYSRCPRHNAARGDVDDPACRAMAVDECTPKINKLRRGERTPGASRRGPPASNRECPAAPQAQVLAVVVQCPLWPQPPRSSRKCPRKDAAATGHAADVPHTKLSLSLTHTRIAVMSPHVQARHMPTSHAEEVAREVGRVPTEKVDGLIQAPRPRTKSNAARARRKASVA